MAVLKYAKQIKVTTPGTRVRLTPHLCQQVIIRALAANTNKVYIGDNTVSSANGYHLAAGEQLTLPVEDAGVIYIDSAVANEGIAVIVI